MKEPVDLTNFRTMTDGDPAIEQELFLEFLTTVDDGLAKMESSTSDGNREVWRSTAHALKGAALNLGATDLGDLLKKAQLGFDTTDAAQKTNLLQEIRNEFALVKAFLQKPARVGPL